jgi:Fur family transcriptional regulator, peroxide stress response regulator
MTRQRESVYLTLIACESHPTADELMAMVHAVDPEVSQATIYNTLEALVGCGLAQRIPSPTSGGACRFDANTGDHVHMVLDDGRVLDVPMDLSKRILESMPADVITELSERTGIELSSIKIEFIGKKEVDQALMSD